MENFYELKAQAENGDARAQYLIGNCYYDGNGIDEDEDEAAKWWKLAADQGHLEAVFKMAGVCELEEKQEDAVNWLKISAEKGHALSQTALGQHYDNGLGVEENYSEALKWYKLAAEQGEPHAQYMLGCHHANPNWAIYEEAVKWFTLSAKQGHPYAQTRLAELYIEGKGVGKDFDEALKWYKLAAAQEEEEAIEWLEERDIGY